MPQPGPLRSRLLTRRMPARLQRVRGAAHTPVLPMGGGLLTVGSFRLYALAGGVAALGRWLLALTLPQLAFLSVLLPTAGSSRRCALAVGVAVLGELLSAPPLSLLVWLSALLPKASSCRHRTLAVDIVAIGG